MKAKYKCMKCGAKFKFDTARCGPCLNCGHLWIEWLNYEKYMKQFKDRLPY